jgi:hypothetical protein
VCACVFPDFLFCDGILVLLRLCFVCGCVWVYVHVCCSVVCNLVLVWFVCGCFVNWSVQVFSFLSIIFVFWSWDTKWRIKSINTIRLILIHHRQNPTEVKILWFCIIYSLSSWRRDMKTKDSELKGSKHSLHLICFEILCSCNFDSLVLFPNILILPYIYIY